MILARNTLGRVAAPLVALLLAGAVAHAQQNTTTSFSGLKMSGDQPIQIESDRLEVLESESKAIFTGNVNVVQGPTLLKAGKMTVFYAKGSGPSTATGAAAIDRLEVDGKVYIKSEDQVATGDRGVFDMKTEVLVLSGSQVVLSQGPNMLMGCKLTANMKTGRAQVEGCAKTGSSTGRVIMSITPGSQSQ